MRSTIHLFVVFLFMFVTHDTVSLDCESVKANDALQFGQSIAVSVRYDCRHTNDFLTHCCTGIILSESYVLTRANCFDDLRDGNVIMVAALQNRSEAGEIIRKIDRIIIHPNATNNRSGAKDNIALLHMSTPLDFGGMNDITRACGVLHSNYSSNSKRRAVITWDLMQSKFGTMAEIKLQPNDEMCHEFIGDMQRQVCVRFQRPDSCDYMSGEFILQSFDDGQMEIGVISEMIKETNGNCMKVFTRLGSYDHWIESVLSSEQSNTSISVETYRCNVNKVSCGCTAENVVLSSGEDATSSEEAIPHSWGMVVFIRLNDFVEYSCGGSIISHSYVLTSAHCVENGLPQEISVVAGMHSRMEDFVNLRYVRRIFIHPQWNRNDSTYQNDIALLNIFPPLPVNSNIKLASACVPYGIPSYNISNYPSNGSHLVIAGWSSTRTNDSNPPVTLQQASVYVLDNEDPTCLESIHDRERQFCATALTTDSCHGDDGNPIFQWKDTHWEQVGITSSGGQCNSSIFTRLAYYFDWMESVANISLTTTTTKPPIYSCNKTSTCGCGRSDVALTSSRIVGGEDAIENSWPMIISLRLNGSSDHSCGGTIVSKSYVLTAAHCLRRVTAEHPVGISIAAGMTNRLDPLQIIRNADRIHVHPDYAGVADDYRHDIALIHIGEPFIFESNATITRTCIHRIDLPLLTNEYPKSGTPLSVIGWGVVASGSGYLPDVLQQVQVFSIDNNESICLNIINDTELQFCAGLFQGGKDSCQGDSGGPIFQWTGQYWEQVGIVSYGNGCAQPDFPGVYTRLSYYYHWIEEILQRDDEHLEPQVPRHTTSSTVFTITDGFLSTGNSNSTVDSSPTEVSSSTYDPLSTGNANSTVNSPPTEVSSSTVDSTPTENPSSTNEFQPDGLFVGLSILLLYIDQIWNVSIR